MDDKLLTVEYDSQLIKVPKIKRGVNAISKSGKTLNLTKGGRAARADLRRR